MVNVPNREYMVNVPNREYMVNVPNYNSLYNTEVAKGHAKYSILANHTPQKTLASLLAPHLLLRAFFLGGVFFTLLAKVFLFGVSFLPCSPSENSALP